MEVDRKKYAYNYLINSGYSPVIASGIVGNLIAESNLKTDVLGTADNKGSNGIAQWHSERLDGLKTYAKNKGKSWTNLDIQLDYIDHELNTTHKTALNKLKYARTPEEASEYFMQHYEKPAKWAIAQSRDERAKNARDLFGGTIDPNYVSQYQDTESQPTKNYLPNDITMQEKRVDEFVDLSFAEKADEAKKQIQEYQEAEDLISQMPIAQQEQTTIQPQQQTPSYEYLFNQNLFTIQ